MSTTVYAGAVAPEAYVLNLTPGASGLDLSTVSAATLQVRNPDGTTQTWACILSNQTSTTLTLTHSYVLGDVPLTGDARVFAALTVPGGTARSVPQVLEIEPTYGGP